MLITRMRHPLVKPPCHLFSLHVKRCIRWLYNVDVDVAKNVVKDKGEIVAKLKFAKAGKPAIIAAVVELNKAK
ncbi:hypothetical protein Tco_0770534 [Tanacetum coccineum]|uniref:Uncharacterized protein n=1 Tax=Tanacetum coccineum TaxID=301880 RepID=A0ABQ4ZCH7_9ASTR